MGENFQGEMLPGESTADRSRHSKNIFLAFAKIYCYNKGELFSFDEYATYDAQIERFSIGCRKTNTKDPPL